MTAAKKSGLGRGLDALFADVPVKMSEADKKEGTDEKEENQIHYIHIHEIMPNVNQPRKVFAEEKIEELADSIREHGIIQPLILRKRKNGYEIVAGERRWRAAMRAGLSEVPCLIRELTDEQNMLIAIIENMQREDLNPIEEAEGLYQMISTFGLTQEQVSKSVGKSRPYIANALRLLKLPEEIREKLAEGLISGGHARALLSVKEDEVKREICDRIIKENLSVRETEKLAASFGKEKQKKAAKKIKNPNLLRVEAELKDILGTKVNITQNGKKGKIEIQCYSKEDMNRLIDLLKKLG